MTSLVIRPSFDFRKMALAGAGALAFFLLGFFAARMALRPASPNQVRVIPCRQCPSCSCPRLSGETMCGCPR